MRSGAPILLATLVALAAPANAQAPESMQQRRGMEVQNPGAPGPMAAGEVDRLIGTKAVDAAGKEVGEIDNLLADEAGQVRAVVLEWGGLLNLGQRQAVVPMDQVRLEGDRLVVDASRDQLERLPNYDPDVPAIAGIDPDLKPVR